MTACKIVNQKEQSLTANQTKTLRYTAIFISRGIWNGFTLCEKFCRPVIIKDLTVSGSNTKNYKDIDLIRITN